MKILIAEDDSVSRRVLEATLVKWGYEVIVAQDGDEALAALQSPEAPPLAILDWIMPGMDGIEVCSKARLTPSATPTYIILLTAKTKKEDVIAGLDSGADDYLTKPFESSELRARIEVGVRIVNLQKNLAKRLDELNLALAELKKAEAEVRNLSMTDELTDLYNRRGFLILSRQQQKVARRIKKPFSIIYADMDGLKKINDTYGHQEGSKAIVQIAQILRESFRESDIIARLGGDEFTIFATDMIAGNNDTPLSRLRENLSMYNKHTLQAFQLALSVGVISVTAEDDSSIEELLEKADKVMYENKRRKQQLNKAKV